MVFLAITWSSSPSRRVQADLAMLPPGDAYSTRPHRPSNWPRLSPAGRAGFMPLMRAGLPVALAGGRNGQQVGRWWCASGEWTWRLRQGAVGRVLADHATPAYDDGGFLDGSDSGQQGSPAAGVDCT